MSAMSGTLESTPLSAVLQKLSKRTATGQLQVLREGAGERVRLYFRNGNIIHVKSDLRPPDMRLGQLVVRGEYLEEDELGAALRAADKAGCAIGTLLVEWGILQPDELVELLAVQFLDDILFGLEWTAGIFRFLEETPKVPPGDVPILEPDEFLAPALRHLDNREDIEAVVPSLSAMFERTADNPLPPAEVVRNKLTQVDAALYEMLDGDVSVATLIASSRLSRVAVFDSLVRLYDAGVITIGSGKRREPVEKSTKTRVTVKRRSLKEAVVFHSVTALVITEALALGLGLFLTYREVGTPQVDLTPPAERKVLVEAQRARISNGLEAFKRDKGSYPTTLSEPVREGYLGQADLTYPNLSRPWVYRLNGNEFILVTPKR